MEIQETPEGLIVTVKVRPNSGGFRLTKKRDDIVLELASPAREGRANQELLSELPRLLRCEVRIIGGLSSRKKLLLLRGITERELEAVLATR